ncbi:MAG: hypothetical protein L3J39_16230 [Verrucomicrobiales bacterium]|nr:hypothetical protein [Verrucomicrobiales bacterium]
MHLFPVGFPQTYMNKLPPFSIKPAKLTALLILTAISLGACNTTTTTKLNARSGSHTTVEKKRPIKKRAKKLFAKKLGDAIGDFNKDHRAGRLKIKQYGAPGPTTPYYNRLLENELGIKIDIIGDGVIDLETLRYAKQYNSLMIAEIQKKYGPGILQEANRRAHIMEQQVRQSR